MDKIASTVVARLATEPLERLVRTLAVVVLDPCHQPPGRRSPSGQANRVLYIAMEQAGTVPRPSSWDRFNRG
jgi:hypothetical protein